jgi:hypothetical protein
MGQHKTNPTAIAAKNGELPPKKPKPSKREQEAWLRAEIEKRAGIDKIRKLIGGGY